MEEDTLLADGFEEAFIGYSARCGQPVIAVYDVDKCLKILMDRDGMTEEEALEFFEFNTEGAWVGKGTPAFLRKCSLDVFNELMSQ